MSFYAVHCTKLSQSILKHNNCSFIGALLPKLSNISKPHLAFASSDSQSPPPPSAEEKGWLTKLLRGDPTLSSHSSVVGKPKMLYRLVFIKTKPEFQNDFIQVASELLPKFAEPRDDCRLIGAWRTMVGPTDEIVHLWQYKDGYKSLDDMGLMVFPNDPDYQSFQKQIRPMINSQNSQILMQFGFWDEPRERNDKHIYEIRSYQLKAGTMIEWANHWARGIEHRKGANQDVAGMFTHIGDLYTVHHIWAYKSFQERREVRENAWAKPGWSDTVANTVPLIRSTKNRVMNALPYSWLK